MQNYVSADGSNGNASCIEFEKDMSNSTIGCNDLHSAKYALRFKEQNACNTYNNIIHDDNLYGFVLDNMGQVGEQGNYNTCTSDNQWYGNWTYGVNYKTACLNYSDPTKSQLDYNSANSPTYDPSGDDYHDQTTVAYASGNGLLDFVGTGVTTCVLCTPGRTNFTGPQTPSNHSRLGYSEKIAQGKIRIPMNDSAQRLYVMQKDLHSNLLGDTATQNSSTILKTFVVQNASTNLGLFSQADAALAVGDLATTQAVLNRVYPNNVIDNHYLQYYHWMLNMKNGTGLLPTDTTDIYNLATGCPASDGTVVFAARNLYNTITNNEIGFTSGCTSGSTSRTANNKFAAKTTVTPSEETVKEITVYPNPTKGEVNIALPENGKWQIIITDITGRAVWQQTCNGCEGVIKHNFNDSKGLYLIKIINTVTGLQTIKKVTLQ
jgi:hypothetical protein